MELALDRSEVLKRRFRHCATRALMILREYKGHKKRVGRQQVSSMILMNAVKRISPDFFILKEARREVLEDLMDIGNATKILELVEQDKIKISEVTTRIPSPFAFGLILEGATDIMKIDDKQEFLRRMHTMILAKIANEKGKSAKEQTN
jgi:ATP-dependent Lhr-like helicase